MAHGCLGYFATALEIDRERISAKEGEDRPARGQARRQDYRPHMNIGPDCKMISFRLSAKDYEKLRQFRMTQDSRSVSELARVAVNKLICDSGPEADEALETRVNELKGQLHILALELKRLKP